MELPWKIPSRIIPMLLLGSMLSFLSFPVLTRVTAQLEGWYPFVPAADDVTLEYRRENGISYIDVAIFFRHSGFNVSDWGTPTISNGDIWADTEMWVHVGYNAQIVWTWPHSYNLGHLPAGEYVFAFTVWGSSVKNIAFSTTTHDIAVPNLTLSKSIVGSGYPMTINVSSSNLGFFAETFNITVYANSTVLGIEEITLADDGSTSTIFTWNTTGFEKGSYTMSAYATPVLGEVRTDNNNLTDGTVLVTIAGDVNGDRSVNVIDLTIGSLAYGTFKGEPGYNPEADINEDDLVDMRDLVIVARNLGKTDP